MSLQERKDNFIAKAKAFHGDIYDYSKVVYVNMNTKICIIDPIYGEFWQKPMMHLKYGNKQRGYAKNVSENQKKFAAEFIKRAREVHGNLYDYSKVVYVNAHTKVIIIDPIYGEFEQEPVAHWHGQGCPARALAMASIRNTKSQQQFIDEANEVHNFLYDYSKVEYVDSHTKVIIIDPVYGEFLQKPCIHLTGRGCKQRSLANQSLTKEEFIKKAKVIHGDKYDYSKVEYVKSTIKVCIIDIELDEEFWMTPGRHIYNQCGNPSRRPANSSLTVDHINPLSLILSTDERKANKYHPLRYYFELDDNKELITLSANCAKQDKIILFNEEVKCSDYRNDYDVIGYLFKRSQIKINL